MSGERRRAALASRLGRFTSTTRSPALVSAVVRMAPNDPVLSIPIAPIGPCPRIQAISLLVAAVGGGRELLVTQQDRRFQAEANRSCVVAHR